jgi:hypothetical protein
MGKYAIYGLTMDSDLELPGLISAEGEPDLLVRFGPVDYSFPGTGEEGCVRATDEEALLYFKQAGKFAVRGGREIIIEPVPEASPRVLRLIVLGPGIGAVLYQRGYLPLHASAVATDGEVIAFMAERGWGKSTVAAAMNAQGCQLIADDITALKVGDSGPPIVVPGYPQLKLWPEAATFLGVDPETLARLHPDFDKRIRPTTAFSTALLPLKRIYVLGEAEALEMKPLSRQEAFLELVPHTYGRRLFQSARTTSHFFQCANVVKSVPVRSLRRPHSLAMLPNLVRLVEEDLAQDDGQGAVDKEPIQNQDTPLARSD